MHSRSDSLRRARPLLGTLVGIEVPANAAPQALDDAFAVVARVQRLMSAHDPLSELSTVNRGAHVAAVTVDPWTFDVFRLALEIHRESEGVFDCAVGTRQVLAARLPQRGDGRLRPTATSSDIELVSPNRVRFAKRLQVDLGGVAKGVAVDRAVDVLREAGIPWALVNAGGDLRAFGQRSQPVHARLPGGAHVPLGELREGAVATSSADRHPPLGLPVLDGRGGTQMAERLASVFAPTCALADALAKVALVRGAACAPLLARYGAEAVFVPVH